MTRTERELAAAEACIVALEAENAELRGLLARLYDEASDCPISGQLALDITDALSTPEAA